MTTSTLAYARSHTAAYVSDKIAGLMKRLVNAFGFDPRGHLEDVGLDVGVGGERCVAVGQHVVDHQGGDYPEDEQHQGPRRLREPPSDRHQRTERRHRHRAESA